MCLGVPMRLLERDGDLGVGEVGGVRHDVWLHLTSEANVGDYVLAHAGFAISVISEQIANEKLELWREGVERMENDIEAHG